MSLFTQFVLRLLFRCDVSTHFHTNISIWIWTCADYTRCKSCEHTAWVRRRCRPSSSQSQLPNFSMHQVPRVDLSKRLIGNELTDTYLRRSVCAVVTACPTFTRFLNNVPTAYEQYFEICSNSNHILHRLLPRPATASQNYSLRPIPQHCSHLIDSNIIIREGSVTSCLVVSLA